MPIDHAMALTRTPRSPVSTSGAADTSGRKSSATLAAPSASPAQVTPRGLGPSFSSGRGRATVGGPASSPRTHLQQWQKESHDRRLDGDHQRRDSGGHGQLRPMQQPVADEKEEKAEDDPGAPSLASRPLSFPQCPGEEDGPRKEMTGRGGEQRRDRFDRVADGEESRAPDHVDGKEGEDRL